MNEFIDFLRTRSGYLKWVYYDHAASAYYYALRSILGRDAPMHGGLPRPSILLVSREGREPCPMAVVRLDDLVVKADRKPIGVTFLQEAVMFIQGSEEPLSEQAILFLAGIVGTGGTLADDPDAAIILANGILEVASTVARKTNFRASRIQPVIDLYLSLEGLRSVTAANLDSKNLNLMQKLAKNSNSISKARKDRIKLLKTVIKQYENSKNIDIGHLAKKDHELKRTVQVACPRRYKNIDQWQSPKLLALGASEHPYGSSNPWVYDGLISDGVPTYFLGSDLEGGLTETDLPNASLDEFNVPMKAMQIIPTINGPCFPFMIERIEGGLLIADSVTSSGYTLVPDGKNLSSYNDHKYNDHKYKIVPLALNVFVAMASLGEKSFEVTHQRQEMDNPGDSRSSSSSWTPNIFGKMKIASHSSGSEAAGGCSKRMHWRRGHWRLRFIKDANQDDNKFNVGDRILVVDDLRKKWTIEARNEQSETYTLRGSDDETLVVPFSSALRGTLRTKWIRRSLIGHSIRQATNPGQAEVSRPRKPTQGEKLQPKPTD